MPVRLKATSGFTLIELVLSMAIFSFMLLIIVSGIINIAQLHDEALATDQSQTSARTAMDELVQGVRNSTGVAPPAVAGTVLSKLCLATNSGTQQIYYVNAKVLYRSDNCATNTSWIIEPTNTYALTNSGVQVGNFQATVETGGNGVSEQEVRLTLTVGSNNGTTNSTGTACLNSDTSRQFCSIVTLTSGAVPR